MSDKRDPCLSCSLSTFDSYLLFLNHPLVAFIGLLFPVILARSTDYTDHSELRATQEPYIVPFHCYQVSNILDATYFTLQYWHPSAARPDPLRTIHHRP